MIALVALAAAIAAQPHNLLTIDPEHRIVEGIASDGHTIWVSSILDREILACRASCRTLAVIPRGLHPFALAWDSARKRLWIAADCPPGVPGIIECDRGALLAIDRHGRIRTRVARTTGRFHPGDVSASPGGVFVSDSQNGDVYRLLGNRLQPVIAPGVGRSAQGTALAADAKHLLVADYSQGVGLIDLTTGSRTLLPRPTGKPLRGIDGVARCGSVYYGIYNGENPGTLVAISVQASGLTVDQPLGDGGSLSDPTQIAYDGKRLLMIENSGWATLDRDSSQRASGARIAAIPLGADCKPR